MTVRASSAVLAPTLIERMTAPNGWYPRARGALRHRAHRRVVAGQLPAAVHAGAVHPAADGRAARRRGPWRASGRDQPDPLSHARPRRPAGVCLRAGAAAGPAAPAGTVGRLPDGLSAGGVRHRLARPARPGSPRRHVDPGDGRGPRRLSSRAACCGWPRTWAWRRRWPWASTRSCSWTRSRSSPSATVLPAAWRVLDNDQAR